MNSETFLALIPRRLRPNPATVGPILSTATVNGWNPADLVSDALAQCTANTGPGAMVQILRGLADSPRHPVMDSSLVADALNPPTKWTWCYGCKSPWQWVDDPDRGRGNLCQHHREIDTRTLAVAS